MNTLHLLRRSRRLSLSQLMEATGIPLRRLAEHEYEGRPLLPAEQDVLAAFFGVQGQHFTEAWTTGIPERSMRQSPQAMLVAALAAGATLALTLHLEPPHLTLARSGAGSFITISGPSATPAGAQEPQENSLSAAEAPERLPASLLDVTPAPVTSRASVVTTPAVALEPAGPDHCPIVPEQGVVVVLRSATTSDEEHGSLKLAVDGNRDGSAEPASTRDASVVAAHDGVVQIAHDTWPGGTQVVIDGREGWRSLYSHLASVAVEPGQHVTPGQLLGRAGNSGRAAGPQLGIQIWHDGQVSDASRLLPCGS